jgi:hypothetical protein
MSSFLSFKWYEMLSRSFGTKFFLKSGISHTAETKKASKEKSLDAQI